MPTTDMLVGTAEAGRLLDKTPRTVQRMVSAGLLIPVATLPGRTGAHLFNRDDVLRLKAERESAA